MWVEAKGDQQEKGHLWVQSVGTGVQKVHTDVSTVLPQRSAQISFSSALTVQDSGSSLHVENIFGGKNFHKSVSICVCLTISAPRDGLEGE